MSEELRGHHGNGSTRRLEPLSESLSDLWTAAPPPPPMLRRLSLKSVVRFKGLALAVFLLVGVPVAAAIWLLNPPLYEARASVEVSPMIPRIVYKTEDSGLIPLYQQYLNNQTSVIRSPTVLQRVLDSQAVQGTAWYATPPPRWQLGDPPSLLERLRADLSASVRPRTSFVDVSMAIRDPAEAALIVNTALDEYLKYVYEQSQKFDDDVYQVLTQEYNALRVTIDGLKSTVASLREKLLTASPEELQSQQRQRLDRKTAELESLRQQIAVAEWEQQQLRALIPEEPVASAPANPHAVDPEWRRLYINLKAAEHQVELAGQSLGESNARLHELRANVDYAASLLEIRARQLDDLRQLQPVTAGGERTLEQEVEAHAARIARLKFEESLRAEDVAQENLRVEQTSTAAQLLRKELDDLAYSEERYRDVRQRKIAMEIERRAPASIRVADRAFAPTQPGNTGRRTMLVALALAGAAGCGFVSAYLRASTNPAVQQASDLSLPAPLLGHVPLARRARRMAAHDSAVQAECIRMVRTALLQRIEPGRGCAIQITSAGAGAGKTSVAVLLAESLERCGKRVLLVDADLRHPSVNERYGLELAPGLLDVLTGRADEREAIVQAPGGAVRVLPAGVLGSGDPELLAGSVLSRCLERWRAQYDVVVLDSAPVLPVADARILSRQVDGNVLVIREGHCRRAEVSDAMAQLSAAGGSLLGLVFFSRRRSPAYYGDAYGYHPYAAADEPNLDARGAAP